MCATPTATAQQITVQNQLGPNGFTANSVANSPTSLSSPNQAVDPNQTWVAF
jgi:hypothetical protein